MATYNGNNMYLLVDSVDMSPYWSQEISFTESNATQEVTSGANQSHVQRAGGLDDTAGEFFIVLDSDDLQNYVDHLKPGVVVNATYGPEGSDTGKPKFQGDVIFSSVGHAVNIAKNLVGFSVSMQGADTPTSRIHNGDTF